MFSKYRVNITDHVKRRLIYKKVIGIKYVSFPSASQKNKFTSRGNCRQHQTEPHRAKQRLDSLSLRLQKSLKVFDIFPKLSEICKEKNLNGEIKCCASLNDKTTMHRQCYFVVLFT